MTKATIPHRKSSPAVSNKEAAIKRSRQSRKHTNSDRRRGPAFLPRSQNYTKSKNPPSPGVASLPSKGLREFIMVEIRSGKKQLNVIPAIFLSFAVLSLAIAAIEGTADGYGQAFSPLAWQTQRTDGDFHEADDSEHLSGIRLDSLAAPPSSSEGHTFATASSVDFCRMVLMSPSSHLSRSIPGRVATEFMPWSAASNSYVDIAAVLNQAARPMQPGALFISARDGQRIIKAPHAAHFASASFSDPNPLVCASLSFLEKQERISTSAEDCESVARNHQCSKWASDHQNIANQERWANLIQTIPQTGMMCLACPEDRGMLNEHLIFVRQQIEFFQASVDDIMSHTRGRSKSIAPLQVGIRCRHCSHISAGQRTKGSTYFPSTLNGNLPGCSKYHRRALAKRRMPRNAG